MSDPDGYSPAAEVRVEASEALCRMLGLSREELNRANARLVLGSGAHDGQAVLQTKEGRELAAFTRVDRTSSARDAEIERARFLEMMARNQSTGEILREIERFVESQCPGARCTVEEAPRAEGRGAPIVSSAGIALGWIGVSGGVEIQPAMLEMASQMCGIVIERQQLTDTLAHQAQHDFLTGLPNRFHLLALLDQRLTETEARGGTLAVAFLDLDRFKQINDSLGHSAGDRVLIEAAGRLKAAFQGSRNVAGRMGGDEFCVILTDAAKEEDCMAALRRCLEDFSAPHLMDGRELFVTASVGVSFYPQHGLDGSTLLRAADAAMYRAKRDSGNAVEIFEATLRERSLERLDLENALHRAIGKGEFELLYQPVVSITGELAGMEALLAWNHNNRGRIPPAEFIPLAEQTGLIVPIGGWVLRQACEMGARWVTEGLPVRRMAVNVSALQFSRPNFIDTVRAALASTGFPARLLELELTESLVLKDIGESIQRMTQLRELGVGMAIDDFGTGYSSLNYLRRLPVQELKIDQSFLRDVRENSGTLNVVRTIVDLAHAMNLTVIAEGVETEEQLELVRGAGCDKVQGHLYGEAQRRAEMEKMLRRAAGYQTGD